VAAAPVAPPSAVEKPPAHVDEPSPGRTKTIAGVAVGLAGVAALAVGAVFAVGAQSAGDQLSNPTKGQVFDPSLESTGQLDQTLAITCFAVGGVALAAGVALVVLGRLEAKRASSMTLAPAVAPGRAGLVWGWRF
jgi:hypothetical protein